MHLTASTKDVAAFEKAKVRCQCREGKETGADPDFICCKELCPSLNSVFVL